MSQYTLSEKLALGFGLVVILVLVLTLITWAVNAANATKIEESPTPGTTPTDMGAAPGTMVKYANMRPRTVPVPGGTYIDPIDVPTLDEAIARCQSSPECWGVIHARSGTAVGIALGKSRILRMTGAQPPFSPPMGANGVDYYHKVR